MQGIERLRIHYEKGQSSSLEFDSVYSVCGGCMFLMNLFCVGHCVGGIMNEDPMNVSMVMQEERK